MPLSNVAVEQRVEIKIAYFTLDSYFTLDVAVQRLYNYPTTKSMKTTIIFSLFLIVSYSIAAQITIHSIQKTTQTIPQKKIIFATTSAIAPQSMMFTPKYSVNQLPFFCKIEAQLEQKINMPIKFRLGSVEYVDWLEGKRKVYDIPKN